jgi:pyruvate/2-oxoglutarate dehydrogenase complex dihydrolipoamide dehydrogenase (E3) component
MKRLGVTVQLSRELTVDDVDRLNPDIIYVATGGKPLIPTSIEGVDLAGVVSAEDVVAGLVDIGAKVAIIGGSSMGVETAEVILQESGREVLVVEMLPKILSDISHDSELVLLDKLTDKNFRFLDSTAVRAVVARDDKLDLVVNRYAQESRLHGFDTIVLAVGVVPDNRFGLELSKRRKNVYLIGDCEAPGDYRKAIHDAAEIAITV